MSWLSDTIDKLDPGKLDDYSKEAVKGSLKDPLTGGVISSLTFLRDVTRQIDPLGTEAAKAEAKEAAVAQAELNEATRIAQENEQLRTTTAAATLAASKARARRIAMAEGLVGVEYGLMSTTPVEGTNLTVNNIPSLDPVDDMGNTVPEVA